MGAGWSALDQVGDRSRPRARNPRRSDLGGVDQPFAGQDVGEGVRRLPAPQDPHTGTAVPAGGEILDLAVVQAHRPAAPLLGVDLGEAAATGQRRGQHVAHDVVVQGEVVAVIVGLSAHRRAPQGRRGGQPSQPGRARFVRSGAGRANPHP